jgi:general secretion pathway protein E
MEVRALERGDTTAPDSPTEQKDVQAPERKSLEDLLLARGRVSAEDIRKVRLLQQERGERLERLLLDLGFISEDDLISLLSEHLGIPLVGRKEFPAVAVTLPSVNVQFLRHAKILPLEIQDGTLTVAMADPSDLDSMHGLQVATGLHVRPFLGREKEIIAALEGYDETPAASVETEGNLEYLATDEEDVNHLRDLASEAPVIRLVNLLINRAVEQRASDVHIEPFENELKVRYRIDGVLHDIEQPPRRQQAAIVSRVKIMAKLNIAERRLPQDGRIKLRTMGKEIDLRVSTLPTLYGESVVLRILDRSSIVLDLEQLGFPADTLGEFEKLIVRPYGMILVTGPTGSGKTTTLYGALEKINSPDKKIITIEDPVEYQVSGVNQIHVKPQIGLTFANGLRSIVRQDPDVIMVGEIRDPETAEIAVQAALTGHLVFSTLHTNDAAGAVSRLLEMGVEDYLLASSLLGVLAQRLVRKVCIRCREAVATDEALLGAGDVSSATVARFASAAAYSAVTNGSVYRAAGCEECSGTGYRGRSGIYELLLMNEGVREQILKHASADAIKATATARGMRTLRDDGWLKVREGTTTVAEVLRVTQEE